MIRVIVLLIVSVIVAATVVSVRADEPPRELTPIGRLPDSIREASGLCKSRQHKGVFWTHSDSGNPPHLFAITGTGQLLKTYRVHGAMNLDWESIETDDDGRLYLADVGNNLPGIPLKVRWIDIVREPDPHVVSQESTASSDPELPKIDVERKLHFTFPDRPFDVEAIVHWKDQLVLFGKVRERAAPVFVLPLGRDPVARPTNVVALKILGQTLAAPRITGAALTPKRDRLAVCSYDYVRVIELATDDSWQNLEACPSRVIRFAPTEVEGCEWDGDDLLLISEDRRLFSIPCPKK